jgi:hypothetical protein
MDTPIKSHPIRRIIQPWLLAIVILTYAIGLGIAYHLGTHLDWINLFLGLLGAISIIETRNFLYAYFDHPETPVSTLHRMIHGTVNFGNQTPSLNANCSDTFNCRGNNNSDLNLPECLFRSLRFTVWLCFLSQYLFSSPPLRLEKKVTAN